MINFKDLVIAWEAHLLQNDDVGTWTGDLSWKAILAEWQSFKEEWENDNV